MQRPPEPRATRLRPLRSRLGEALVAWGLSVAVVVASLTPLSVQAAPAIPAEAEQHYERGVLERDAGRFAAAAAEFSAAYAGIPASLKDLRAGVLFDLVEAQRRAYAAGGRVRGNEHPAAHLCAADTALTGFIDAAEKERKGKGKRSSDAVRATEVRAEVRAEITKVREKTPELDCETAEVPREDVAEATPPSTQPNGSDAPKQPKPPREKRPIDKPLTIAGGALTAFGLAMIGLMAGGLVRGKRAEADGDALVLERPTTPRDDPELQSIKDRGRSGNGMAIAGGVIGGLALGTGIALLVVGLRGGRSKRVAVAPTFAPRALGMALSWQF